MPRYLKKYNPDLQKNDKPTISQEQEGEGAILNLAIKALSHLIPGLLAKFGEKAGEHVGDEVGKVVKEKISQMRGKKQIKEKQMENPQMEGGAMKDKEPDYSLTLNRRVKGKNTGPISSYENDPEIIPSVAPKKKGKGFVLAGVPRSTAMPMAPLCKPCEEKKGKGNKVSGGGFELAGKKGSGKSARPRGRPRKTQIGTGVVEMKGSGIDVMNMPMDVKPYNKIDKLKEMINNNKKKEPKTEKYKIIKTYNDALKYIMDNMGTSETYSSDLNIMGKKLFKAKFGGVLASDQLPKKISKKYYIVNTDKSDEPGQHWMGVTEHFIYDSFGRSAEELSEFINDRKLINKNNNRDQSFIETNCGQRSLAFLVCHAIHGDRISDFI